MQLISLESLETGANRAQWRAGANNAHRDLPNAEKLPAWLKTKAGKFRQMAETDAMLRQDDIVTVCQEARCPNIGECWSHQTATFMIGGDACTRNCGFCNVSTAKPLALDASEPARVARAAAKLGLRYVVITSVDRDDLPDGGAAHWVETIERVRAEMPDVKVEILTPDWRGNWADLETVAATRPDVYNHNIETVPSLYKWVRPGSKYERSLELLRRVKTFDAGNQNQKRLDAGTWRNSGRGR